MIPHLSPVIEGIGGGVGAMVVWEVVKKVLRALKHDNDESRQSDEDDRLQNLLSEQSRVLEEVRKERQDCRDERKADSERIDALEAKVNGLKADIEKQAHEFQVELRAANEAGRVWSVSAQANDDARRLAEQHLTEMTTQRDAAHDEAVRLRRIIHAIDPEHPDAAP